LRRTTKDCPKPWLSEVQRVKLNPTTCSSLRCRLFHSPVTPFWQAIEV